MNIERIYAMQLRYFYLLRSSWVRVIEMAYWPLVNIVVWGFMTQFLAQNSSWVANAFGVLLGAVLLWEILFRSNLGLALSFFEEVWSRNLGNLAVSPLTPVEMMVSMISISIVRTVIGVLPAVLITMALYDYSLFSLGAPLLAFYVNLMMTGWCVGLIVASMVLRYGQGAEGLAWVVVFAIMPLSGVYYPIDTLPGWLQNVAWFLPSSHIFEGMRAVMFDQGFRLDLMLAATALNVFYLFASGGLFLWAYHIARVKGLLLTQGE